MAILIGLCSANAVVNVRNLGYERHLNSDGRAVADCDSAGNGCGSRVVGLYGLSILKVSAQAGEYEWYKGEN
jgi:hypothetical protein